MATFYIVDTNRVYTGESIEKSDYDTWGMQEIPVAPPVLSNGEFAVWNGSEWVITSTYPTPVVIKYVPQVLTPRQARLALLQATLLDEVEAMLATNKEMQIWWEYSLEIQRSHPHIVSMATALGMTEAQLDDLFILGATL